MTRREIREKAIELRATGMKFADINQALGIDVPKGTLAYWFRDVHLPEAYVHQLKEENLLHIKRIQKEALRIKKVAREGYLRGLETKNNHLGDLIKNPDVAKIVLAMLYLGEGGKTLRKAAVVFGNSDPAVIKLFIKLLRACYKIDESKFRCTVQCRVDQPAEILREYWSSVTNIPLEQCYKPLIDPRTLGKPSKKKNYKGVCRIEYFSSEILLDLLASIKVLLQGP